MKITNPEARLDPMMVKVLHRIRDETLPDDRDCFIIVEAPERGGKSTFGNLACAVVDPTFEIESRNFYTQEAFQHYATTAEKRTACLNDEGANMWYRRNANTRDNKSGVLMLTMMGQKNLFVIVNVTKAALLEGYMFERAKILVRITKRDKKRKIGWFKFYGPAKVRWIYDKNRESKKRWVYPSASFSGWFKPLTEEEFFAYEKNKFDKIMKATIGEDNPEQSLGLDCVIEGRPRMLLAKAAKELDLSKVTLRNKVMSGEWEGGKDVVGRWFVYTDSIKQSNNFKNLDRFKKD